MIAFNGQYLPAASHGNMRITAACLGGQWVMHDWLKTATQQAIIAAFGMEEGIAVIIRTNDYLNALALTDPTRAQQLAMFINEYVPIDPMTICSFVSIGKDRWIRTSGTNCYFKTGVTKIVADQIVEETYTKYDTGGRRLTGISGNRDGYWGATAGGQLEMHSQGDNDTTYSSGTNALEKNFVRKDYISGADSGELQLFALTGSYNGAGVYRTETKVYRNGELVRWYVPFLTNGNMEYINLLDGTLATRVGTFTEIIEDKPLL